MCQNCKRVVSGTISQDGQTINCAKGYNPRSTKCETPYYGNYGHTPNLVISHITFTQCMEVEVTRKSKCIHCGPQCAACEKCAHNMKGYDGVSVSIVGSLRDREVACSASDRQGSSFESCVWRTVSSQSSHHPQEVLLAQFSLYVHKA